MFIAGIDIAKRNHVARIIDSEGRIVAKPFSFRNSCSGYNALPARMHKITNRKSEFILAVEATSHYWLALLHTVVPGGLPGRIAQSHPNPRRAGDAE